MARATLRRHLDGMIRAFLSRGPERLSLLEKSFVPVHEALARAELREGEWAALKSVLPPIEWYKTWDRCERLRRAAVAVVVAEGGTLEGLLRGADAETVGWLVKSCAAVPGGSELLSKHVRPVPAD